MNIRRRKVVIEVEGGCARTEDGGKIKQGFFMEAPDIEDGQAQSLQRPWQQRFV